MKRSHVPSPIRTSATPTSAAAGGEDYNPNPYLTAAEANNYMKDASVANNNNTNHQYYSNDGSNINNVNDTTTLNNVNNAMPTSAMRQGRFLSPDLTTSNNNNNSGNNTNMTNNPQQQYQRATSPTQVTFQAGAAPSNNTTNLNNSFNNATACNFMFDQYDNFHHQSNNNNNFNSNNNSNIPTEAQLTLLCLDYLRSLRRSYQNPQDLLNGEGLHADYISLAVWSLNRAFAHDKLEFGDVKLSRVLEDGDESSGGSGRRRRKDGSVVKQKEIWIVGGGGLAGVEDECVGNDSVYRLDDVKMTSAAAASGGGNDDLITSPKELFALTDRIKLPSMEDITNEVLLSYNTSTDNNDASNNTSNTPPIYEQNDLHLSNSHRFYLFNGMASGDDPTGMMGGNSTNNSHTSPKHKQSRGPSMIDGGGPLTLTDLTSVALTALNAKSRIDAEREVVQDSLFESFITAASEKGFFREKKLSEGEEGELDPEEMEYRHRLLFESKYRKVVAKFRSKLAVREEQQMLHHGGMGGGGGAWSPRSGQMALRNVQSVSDTLEMRRERIIEEVKGYRVEVEEGEEVFVPHSLVEPQQQSHYEEQQQQQQHSHSVGHVIANYERERHVDSIHNYQEVHYPVAATPPRYEQQTIPQHTEVDDEPGKIVVERTIEVERAPVIPSSPIAAPPSPVASSPSRRTQMMDPPTLSPDRAPKIPPSPAAKLPFYQEAENINAQGNELMQKKQFSKALELYSAALKISPAGPQSHVYYSNRAAAHLSLGDVESSMKDSQSALTIRPDYAKAHSRLGLAHYASGRYEEAVESYEAALELDPDNEWVNIQYQKASRMLAKMTEENEVMEEDNGNVSERSSVLAKERIDAEATRRVALLALEKSRKADEYKDIGNAFMKNKKFEEALHHYNLAIESSADGPNSHIYYSNRAAAYCYLGQYSDAADDCLSSIRLNDSYEKAYSRYGLSLFFLGDYQGSIDAYRKSLELAPDNKASLSYLAKARSRLAEQQENEMQEDMAKKLHLGSRQQNPGVGNDELDREIEQDGNVERNIVFSQSRDEEGEGFEASPPGQALDPPAFDPFNADEGDEI